MRRIGRDDHCALEAVVDIGVDTKSVIFREGGTDRSEELLARRPAVGNAGLAGMMPEKLLSDASRAGQR